MMTSMIRWLDERSKGSTRQWSPDQSCGSSHWSPAPLPLCPLPFNSLILLVIWSVSPTRHPSTDHLSSSEQWTIQASNLRKNWQNRELRHTNHSQRLRPAGQWGSVYVCMWCNRRAREIGFMPGWWLLVNTEQYCTEAHPLKPHPSQCDFIKGSIISFHYPINICLPYEFSNSFSLWFAFFCLSKGEIHIHSVHLEEKNFFRSEKRWNCFAWLAYSLRS